MQSGKWFCLPVAAFVNTSDGRIEGLKTAVLWSRVGPYHLARLKGARECGVDVTGIEVASDDGVYEWEPAPGVSECVVTIFQGRGYDDVAAREIRAGVARTLDALGCKVVAVNGWSVPEARAAIAWRRAVAGRRAVLMSETKRDDGRRFWWTEWLKRRTVLRCDTALVGGWAQSAYLCELGMDSRRVFTGYDAVDNAYFADGAAAARSAAVHRRRDHELPECFFLACTRFLPRKNVDGLLRAYQQYRSHCEGIPWGLIVLGSGEEEPGLRQLERDLGLEGVQWPGFIQYDTLPTYYGLASAFIHPAKQEAWGLVVNEAAASGLPLLISRTVGARYELVEDKENGFLFDPDDNEDMAQKMLTFSGMDEAARQRMGVRSEEIVAAWSPRNFGEQLLRAAELAVSLPDR